LLRAQKAEGFNDDQAAYISGSLLEAGSDTTASTLYGFILACIIWPDVQRKMQEIDRVVGPDHLPTIEDYQNLPYVRACIKESIRWMPTVILGVPHATLQEDTYKGWRIPAGATVINNVWAIHMDPHRSPSPRVFNPDRFASDPRSLYESATGEAVKRDNYVFRARRRLCQGIHIAERSLALGISRLVWASDFSPVLYEKTGKPVAYGGNDLVGDLTVQPQDYKCNIESRSDNQADIIRDAVRRDASEFLDPVTGQWSKTPENMAFSTYIPEDIKA
jgi:cytochrome P450